MHKKIGIVYLARTFQIFLWFLKRCDFDIIIIIKVVLKHPIIPNKKFNIPKLIFLIKTNTLKIIKIIDSTIPKNKLLLLFSIILGISNIQIIIPKINQISSLKIYEIIDTLNPWVTININFKVSAIKSAIYALNLLENVDVTKNIKNNAYKYQYGAVGLNKIISYNLPISLFTELENNVFNIQVINENVTNGIPKEINFFKTFLYHELNVFTTLNFW